VKIRATTSKCPLGVDRHSPVVHGEPHHHRLAIALATADARPHRSPARRIAHPPTDRRCGSAYPLGHERLSRIVANHTARSPSE
jgi:hypothetical protein